MSYKVYVTYICYVILNNIQTHFNPSRTYKQIHQSIFFGHLLLRMHYSMAPPGLDPKDGSQRFISFLVQDFSSSDLGCHVQARGLRVSCLKCMNVSTCVYVPTVRLV